ncbi:MAG: hypothetical protein ACFBSD_10995 [Paracoccaceae bacterium]
MIRSIVLAAALLAAIPAAATAPLEGDAPVTVQFRELFDGGKPSALAQELNGRAIEIVGFFAPPPTAESPFYVLVGAPAQFCPYCSAVHEQDHLPYVLVYPEGETTRYGARARIRIVGRLDAGVNHENFYGIHNDLRLFDAVVLRDRQRINPVRQRAASQMNPDIANSIAEED